MVGRGCSAGLAAGDVHCGPGCAVWAGWSGLRVAGGSADAGEQLGPGGFPGQVVGRCRVSRRAEEEIRAGTVMRVRRIVAVLALAKEEPVIVAATRVRLNAMVASTSHAPLARDLEVPPTAAWPGEFRSTYPQMCCGGRARLLIDSPE